MAFQFDFQREKDSNPLQFMKGNRVLNRGALIEPSCNTLESLQIRTQFRRWFNGSSTTIQRRFDDDSSNGFLASSASNNETVLWFPIKRRSTIVPVDSSSSAMHFALNGFQQRWIQGSKDLQCSRWNLHLRIFTKDSLGQTSSKSSTRISPVNVFFYETAFRRC